MVLSSWEANILMPTFRAGSTVARLHLFAPRTCLATRSTEDLLLYATPAPPIRWHAPRALVLTLLLFAGQLYLRTYDDYTDVCKMLGAPYPAEHEEGAVQMGNRETSAFGPDAIPFFLALFEQIRHPSADLSNTDIGRILAGDVLPRSAFSGTLRVR